MLRIVVLLMAAWLVSATAAFGASQADPAAIVQQYYEAVNRRDITGIVALVTDDHVHEGGPCRAGPCVGKAAFQQALERAAATLPTIRVLDTRLSGSTVTTRVEVRPPAGFIPEPLRAQGVERLVELETFEMLGDKFASIRSVPDPSDPQTATALAFFASQSPQAAPVQVPRALPRTGNALSGPIGFVAVAGAGLLGLGLGLRRLRRRA